MRIGSLRIRNFRSIRDLRLDLVQCTAIAGANSCGKSNILRAIMFPFQAGISKEQIYESLPRDVRDTTGAPRLSIYIDIDFLEATAPIAKLAGAAPGRKVTLAFRAIRSGTVTYHLNKRLLEKPEELLDRLSLLYVPPIRDLQAGGMDPFRVVLGAALKKARGPDSLGPITSEARRVLGFRADALLGGHRDTISRLLGADALEADTSSVHLEDLYQKVELRVAGAQGIRSLKELGTGHQSAVIVNLYRQMGEQTPGERILLLEEPDNHLHPSTIRSVANDLLQLAGTTQVVLTTHSPVMLDAIGLRNLRAVVSDDAGVTGNRNVDVSGYTDAEINRLLAQYNIRAVEPLFCKKVILVEGPLDHNVLNTLLEVRHGVRCGRDDTLLLHAGGKDGVTKLCHFLSALGVEWKTVLDWDAAYSTHAPAVADGIHAGRRAEAITAAGLLTAVADERGRRGKELKKRMAALIDELGTRKRLAPTPLTGSVVERLLQPEELSDDESARLIRALSNRSKRAYQQILNKYGIWLWSGELEDVILARDQALDDFENWLIERKLIRRPASPQNRTRTLKNRLSDLAHEPELVSDAIRHLYDRRAFSYTEVNTALDYLVS
jgi:predicted ATP-dependent endonuclease of OLD family